ncbi:methylase involved in ubiquinone/menaquinone biosynthesis [Aciduliprofundum sp. MAR08-339]|uniref:class I SAM-dependent methyltransferase n=1 Tax=Aciduliprofundum sp. (strain MAR08-339) TaxID=673860 RepID=UPI0002A4A560|nr:methylase involved in ubiquinone/menaquinone biosynthesis [Aciduliprofundum sp. MAR08-339]
MFDPKEYDSWYDRHREIFEAEVKALRPMIEKYPNPKLEIGVGTGRFSQALGITYGIDPDQGMLELARKRGIDVIRGIGENLPYKDESFYAVLISTTLPFLRNAKKVVEEAHRVLVNNGGLVIGFIPRNSHFGRKYTRIGEEGDERFKNAHFYTMEEVESLLENLFFIVRVRSTLLGEDISLNVVDGYREDASFVAIEGVKIQNV